MPPAQHSSSMNTAEDAKRAARHAFLNDVVSQLTPREWRDLQELAARKFNFDVFGHLPVELVHRIADYLEDLDIISSRRVSKRWQEILRSEELCRRLCFQNRFTCPHQLPKNTTWESLLSQKSSIQHSLVCGRPWSKVGYQLTLPDREALRNVVYHNGKLAYIRYSEGSDTASSIRIVHFDTGERISRPLDTLLPLPVGPVYAMALSDSFFACVLKRLLFIHEHSVNRSRTLLLPTAEYNNVAITGDNIVVWNTLCEGSTPISTWDSRSKTLKHFRCQKTHPDFAVVRHADETILLLGVSSLRASGSVVAKQYDPHGNLDSSQGISCPDHPLLNTYISRNEFSKVLFSDLNPSITFPDYRFTPSNQKLTNANFDFNAATCTLTCSTRRSQLPVADFDKQGVKRLRLNGFTVHSQNVFSIAYKNCSLPNPHGIRLGWFNHEQDYFIDGEHESYCWQGARTLTYNTSELHNINLAICGQPDNRGRSRYLKLWKWFGDERFLVKCFDNRFEVYCFDKTFPLAMQCDSYRKERDRRATERSNQRKEKADRIAQR